MNYLLTALFFVATIILSAVYHVQLSAVLHGPVGYWGIRALMVILPILTAWCIWDAFRPRRKLE